MEYKVQQKATIWYEARIEADSAEEAIKKAYEHEVDGWWQALDSTEFLDEYWTEETGLATINESNEVITEENN